MPNRSCGCPRCTSRTLAALEITQADNSLWSAYQVLESARTFAEQEYDRTRAAIKQTESNGITPTDDMWLASELARDEANRAHAARQLLEIVGSVLEGKIDLDKVAVHIVCTPVEQVESRG